MFSGDRSMLLMKRLHKSLLKSGCIPSGSRVLVAISGGADSVALLALLHQLTDELQLHLEAAHLDHSLRPESRDDAAFCCRALHRSWCSFNRLYVRMWPRSARQRKGNLEETARDLRREFLHLTAQARDCDLIAMGHHADDQAETFLFRLLRGSGVKGLASMRAAKGLYREALVVFFSSASLWSTFRQKGSPGVRM